jgi:heme exporter protein D
MTMTYANYVAGAYAVFAAVLAWDFFAPRLRLARVRRQILQREKRDAARAANPAGR